MDSNLELNWVSHCPQMVRAWNRKISLNLPKMTKNRVTEGLESLLGASWEALGAIWRHLERSWRRLGDLGELLGASWVELWASWRRFGAILGRLGRFLGVHGRPWRLPGTIFGLFFEFFWNSKANCENSKNLEKPMVFH